LEKSSSSSPALRRERGQSLVELAFILPVFALILVGVADLGRAFYESVAIQSAAEAGGLTALDYTRNASGGGNSAVLSAIKGSTNPDVFPFLSIQDSDINLSILWQQDSQYTITVTRRFHLMTPLLGNVLASGQNLTLRSEVRGRQNCSGGC
jgi:Flp pilus assembly protein TadG